MAPRRRRRSSYTLGEYANRVSGDDFTDEWIRKIRYGQRYMKKYSTQPNWDVYRKMYRGDWEEDILPVNRVFSLGRSLVPEVYFRAPRVTVTAKKPQFVIQSVVMEAILNYLIDECKLKRTLKRAITVAYQSGICPIKLGYDSEFGYTPEQGVDQDTSTMTRASRKDGRDIEYATYVKPGMPWAMRELPDNVIYPPGYTDHEAMPWIAHEILRPLEDVLQDQKYKNTRGLRGKKVKDLENIHDPRRKIVGQEEHEWIQLWEVRDASRKEVYVFADDRMILAQTDILQIEGLNWEHLVFNEDVEYPWGISDVHQISTQQMELNETRTQSNKHRKIALLKFLYLKGAIKEDQLEHLLSGEVGPAVGVDGDVLLNAIHILQPHIPPDLQFEARQLIQDMGDTIGYNENDTSDYKAGTPPSAAETMRVGGRSDNRNAERRDIVADVMINIVRKWAQYIQAFWTGERVVEIAGPGGAMYWVSAKGSDLAGEYNYKIDPDSGQPISRELKMGAAEKLIKTFGGDQLINQDMLRRKYLEQYEWIFPGATGILNSVIEEGMAQALSRERQPRPMLGGGAGNATGTNQGGGKRPGQVMNMDKFDSAMKGGK